MAKKTTFLAYGAAKLGHDVWYISVHDFAYGEDEQVYAQAYSTVGANLESNVTFIRSVCADENKEYLNLSELDVLMLRNDPSDDARVRPWARLAGINFSRFAIKYGVLVLNDPDGLTRAVNKLYLQQFPKEIRPETLISRNKEQIKAFAAKQGTIVIKPLVGSGGRNVFLVRPEDAPNLNQMLETVARDGYIIAQEYLQEATNGDVRVFLMNGKVLEVDGKVAAMRRVRVGGDMRSNMTAGATSAPYEPTEAVDKIVSKMTTILKQDGLFLVGIDMVGDKIMEVNVFSPGGLLSAETFNNVNYSEVIIKNIESKLKYHKENPSLTNTELAVMV